MQGYDLFEYAVLRWMPSVEREEFLNIGVVLYCRDQQFLGVRFHLRMEVMKMISGENDIEQLEKNLQAFEQICAGEKSGGKIAELLPAERFRWLTSTRSTILQVSKVHPGICKKASEKLQQLFSELVL